MEQPVEDRRRDHLVVAEDAAPLVEGHVAGHDDGAVRILLADELEEERRALRVHRGIAELIDRQQLLAAQLLELPPERVGDLGGHQAVEQGRGMGEEHPLAGEAGFQRPGERQVGLSLVMRVPS